MHAAADLAAAFPASLSDNGYVVLPNGLILQWLAGAQQAAGMSGAQVLTLPIAFPNRCLHASVSTTLSGDAVPGRAAYAVTGVSTTKVTVERQPFEHDMRGSTPAVLAIGY
ncbi:gp53-like domain-containing protein [Sphingomonas phyllosphaerae]|uniref:gp53-like domain-containing protein n=1 Tax=Sphingomonas phyllosphaerae TaxID=257003 RepID=UPI002413740C|nr:hypothetical protein [Sphingomonas phyllosphaerae]